MKHLALPLAALVALAACGSETDTADEGAVTADSAAPLPSTPEITPSLAVTELPAAALGRWGLVPADCEPGRADAKGLLTIEPNRLRFYESVGTLDEIEEATESSVRADFDFTGEGMTWEREMTLDVEDGGQTLIRQEYGEGAASGSFRYSRCD